MYLYSPLFQETIFIVVSMTGSGIYAYVLLSRLFQSVKVTKKQFLKGLPLMLIAPAIPLIFSVLVNPQHLKDPLLGYFVEFIIFEVILFVQSCRGYFLHGKKKLKDTYKSGYRL